MKAAPLLITWHDDSVPIYSVHFDPNGGGRLATAGDDNNVRLWRVEATGEDRKVTYLSTLVKHTQAVNVVRFCPKGEMLASAGDDGNVLLWVPSELQALPGPGEDCSDDKEIWRVKHMCRSSGAEIYDLAWSPDGVFFITGSMDNIARIYNAQTGQMVRQIAEHSHYVQGVAWDPLNEFVATQSSDRSVHIYSLKTKDGQFSLSTHGKFFKMDMPAKRTSSSGPAQPDLTIRIQHPVNNSTTAHSPGPSTPSTPMTSNLPMDPPPVSSSRRSSFGSSPSIRRSASPVSSLPLPAVKPLEAPSPGILSGIGAKGASIYANETLTSFFRRLTFSPDGSLLFTPAGQYKTTHPSATDSAKSTDEIINTVYVYTRAGFNKPPVSHLPGHKKPSVAVKCSPIYYTLRCSYRPVHHITLNTPLTEEVHFSPPDPAVVTPAAGNTSDEVIPSAATDAFLRRQTPAKTTNGEDTSTGQASATVFALPYRIVYAVATQDAVLVYDTEQQTPICVVSNLHFATFTDLSWSNDGLTLIMSSSDGFCSTLSFAPGELGQPYSDLIPAHLSASCGTSSQPPSIHAANSVKANPIIGTSIISSAAAHLPPPSPTRSNSVGSITNQTSTQKPATIVNNPTPTFGAVPLVTAVNSSQPLVLPMSTPPQTPMYSASQSGSTSASASVLGKRDSEQVSELEKHENKSQDSQQSKRRRIAPTLVLSSDNPRPGNDSHKTDTSG